MSNATIIKEISTRQRIEALGLSAGQRVEALATLALADALVSAIFALGKHLTSRQTSGGCPYCPKGPVIAS